MNGQPPANLLEGIRVLLVYPNLMAATHPPLSLAMLSAVLKHNGAEVRLFDTTFYRTSKRSYEQHKLDNLQIPNGDRIDKPVNFKCSEVHDDFKNVVESFQPQMIGITMVESTSGLALDLADSIVDSGPFILAGGIFPTMVPDHVLMHRSIDAVCMGEGEETIIEVCRHIKNGTDPFKTLNLAYWKGTTLHFNMIRPPCDLDSLPYADFTGFEPASMMRPRRGRMHKTVNIEMDRGCPFHCTFCSAPALGQRYAQAGMKYYRLKSPKRIIEELEDLVRSHQPDYINLCSESLLVRPLEQLREISVLYRDRIGLPFWCQSRPETIDGERVMLLGEMGCDHLQFGVEHGNRELRSQLLGRSYSNSRVVEAADAIHKVGIPFTTNNIMGLPGETRDMVFETIELNRQIMPYSVKVFMFAPFAGTALNDLCRKEGRLDHKIGDPRFDTYIPLKGQLISSEEYRGLLRTFPLQVFLPEVEREDVVLAESFSDEGNDKYEELVKRYRSILFPEDCQIEIARRNGLQALREGV
jgi:anaerobic magnesium-protoporphyrin IX monomethyl ester cyclase